MAISSSKIRENQPSYQKKYRRAQSQKGLVRYEIQVSEEAKAKFEEAVTAIADEYTLPYSEKARKAKARAQLFEELTQGASHEFTVLMDKIDALRAEIKALSPSFFITDVADKTPLPEAINALPDDCKTLKYLLARTYREAQQSKLSCVEYKRQAEQFEKLYKAFYNANENLTKELKQKTLHED